MEAAEQAKKNNKAPALYGETDDDVFLRSYGLTMLFLVRIGRVFSNITGTRRDSIDAVMERLAPSGSNETSPIYRKVFMNDAKGFGELTL